MTDIVERLTAEWPDVKDAQDGAKEIIKLREKVENIRNETLEEAALEIEKVGHKDYPNKIITDGYAQAVRSLKSK